VCETRFSDLDQMAKSEYVPEKVKGVTVVITHSKSLIPIRHRE